MAPAGQITKVEPLSEINDTESAGEVFHKTLSRRVTDIS